MNVLDVWAHKLAEEVAPQESDLASLWVRAFAEGGAARRELYASAGATAGGFLPGVATPVLTMVLRALSGVAAAIVPALASRYAADLLGCVKNGLASLSLRYAPAEIRLRAADNGRAYLTGLPLPLWPWLCSPWPGRISCRYGNGPLANSVCPKCAPTCGPTCFVRGCWR